MAPMKFIDQTKIMNLSENYYTILQEQLEERSYKKGDIIINEGSRNYFVFFVKEGLVRGYILRGDKYRTFLFAFDGDMIVTPHSLYNSTNISKLTLEAVTDTILLKISREQLAKLFNESIEFANWGRKLFEKILVGYEEYFFEYFWENKTVQYSALIKQYPQLLQKVSLKDLASYLNITPQSLSRIRAQIK